MRWGRRRVNPLKVVLLITLIALLGGVYSFSVLEKNLKETILAYGEVKARALAVDIMNDADSQISQIANYNDLVHIQTDVNGKIVMMQLNSLKINEMTSVVVENIQNGFREDGELEIEVPVGQALGSKILASKGPKIKIRIIPVGSVNVGVRDEFTEAGINQTKHRIIMEIQVTVRVVVPLVSSVIEVENETPIAETIIIGDVPAQYFNLQVGKY
jgi:sporulation protein YunB